MHSYYKLRPRYDINRLILKLTNRLLIEIVKAKIKLFNKVFFLVILEADLANINNTIYPNQIKFLEIIYYKIK